MKYSLFVFEALFAGALLTAGELDVDGNFMKLNPQDTKKVVGWEKSWKHMKDIGTVTIEKGSAADRNAVRIKTTKLLTPYTSAVYIPVTPGKEVTISFDAKGTGRIGDCFYIHGMAPEKKYYGRFHNPNVSVTPEFKRYVFTFRTPAEYSDAKGKKGVPGFVRPGVCAFAGSDIVIENVKVDVK